MKNVGIKRRCNLIILQYALDALAKRQITVRQMFLLSYADRWCNSYLSRNHKTDDACDRSKFAKFGFGDLRRLLKCCGITVRRTIRDLEAKHMIRVHPVNLLNLEIETRKRKGDAAKAALTIPLKVLELFESGMLTPMGALLLAYVASFTLCGKPFFASNRHIGKLFGVKDWRVRQVILSLITDGFLKERVTTKEAFHQEWADYKCQGNNRQTVRLLIPKLQELKRQRKDDGLWDDLPDVGAPYEDNEDNEYNDEDDDDDDEEEFHP